MRKFKLLIILIFTCLYSNAQHLAFSHQQADSIGISFPHLDSLYKSATHADSSKAVFKSDEEQEKMYNAYVKLLRDFGKYLTDNNFLWEKRVRGFNRIYFSEDGSIDYFLYNFHFDKTRPEDTLTPEQEAVFGQLLNLFIQYYKIPLMADSKFVQCSGAWYGEKPAK